jgi:hypothetical protein
MIASAHTSTAIGGHFTECQAFVYVQAENAAAKLCDRHDQTSSAPNRKRLFGPHHAAVHGIPCFNPNPNISPGLPQH